MFKTDTVNGAVREKKGGLLISTNKTGTKFCRRQSVTCRRVHWGGTSGQTGLLNNSGRDYTILAQPLGCIISAD